MPLAIFERAMASCEGANFVWFVRRVFASQPKKNDSFFYVFAIFLDLFKVIFYFLPWKITSKPPFGRICVDPFSKHVNKQIQVVYFQNPYLEK